MVKEYESPEHPSRKEWEEFFEREGFLEEGCTEMIHLEGCQRCRESVCEILEADHFLLDQLVDALHPETIPEPENTEDCLETKVLWGYSAWKSSVAADRAADSSADPYQQINDHINECERCLREFRRIRLLQIRLKKSDPNRF